jgi:hypothetical protein
MIDKKMITEKFFRDYLRDEVVSATDFTTLIHHDIQFIDKDYNQFVCGLLWSAKTNGKRAYFYVVLKIGNELAKAFVDSIIKEAIDKIVIWHKEEFPNEPHIPKVGSIVFQCDRKPQTN